MIFLQVVKNLIKNIVKIIFNTIKDIISNIESVIILSFAAIGLTTILVELPFHYALPAFIDAPMVIPVLSVLIITSLIISMTWRIKYAGASN